MPEPDIARYKYILDEILRLTDDGFIVVDPQGVVTDINEQYCDFLGRTRDEVVGYPITKVIKNSKMIDIVRRRYSEELALHKYVPGDTKANDDNFVLVSRSCVFDDADQVVAGGGQVPAPNPGLGQTADERVRRVGILPGRVPELQRQPVQF